VGFHFFFKQRERENQKGKNKYFTFSQKTVTRAKIARFDWLLKNDKSSTVSKNNLIWLVIRAFPVEPTGKSWAQSNGRDRRTGKLSCVKANLLNCVCPRDQAEPIRNRVGKLKLRRWRTLGLALNYFKSRNFRRH